MEFQRARSDEQRDHRRRAILATASAMLTEMPVAKLSLNELSRRVGLAKSNVLRYFESREAILLELLNTELHTWISELDLSSIAPDAAAIDRADAVAVSLATSLAHRPVLCDLISAQAAVLERNVSTSAVLLHKRAINVSVGLMSGLLAERLPELDGGEIYEVIAILLLTTSAAWPHSQPTEALLAAYAEDPAIAAHQMEFVDFLQRTLALTISGLLARRKGDLPAKAGIAAATYVR